MRLCGNELFVGQRLSRGSVLTCDDAVAAVAAELDRADAVVVGAGAGLSAAAGLSYSGERFDRLFADFRDAFGITDMYSGGFYLFPDLETYWAWWSRHILANRYDAGSMPAYLDLAAALAGRDYFVLTTNVDHQFQLADIDPDRLFYTQGDYGKIQCSRNCSGEVVDNEDLVRQMAAEQRGMRVPSELVPRCPHCGAPMVPHLRADASFCEDDAWHEAEARYEAFLDRNRDARVIYLELGVGWNTPVIIKYPFWTAVAQNPRATYACVNLGDAVAPESIAPRSILHDGDLAPFLKRLTAER